MAPSHPPEQTDAAEWGADQAAWGDDPSSRGDHLGSLERWREIQRRGVSPAATMRVIKYLALSGAQEEAQTLLEEQIARRNPSIHNSIGSLYQEATGPLWIRAANAILSAAPPLTDTSALQAQLLKAPFLFAVDATHRDLATSMLRRVTVRHESVVPALAFLSVYGTEADLRAFRVLQEPTLDVLIDAAKLIIKETRSANLQFDHIMAACRAFASEPSVLEYLATRLPKGASLTALLLASPRAKWTDAVVRMAANEVALASESILTTWKVRQMISDGENEVALASLLSEIAFQRGFVALALARSLSNSAHYARPDLLQGIAANLAAMGFRQLAADTLNSRAATSETIAHRRAELQARSPFEAQRTAGWREASKLHPASKKIQRGLATALMDECLYDQAMSLFRRAIPADEQPSKQRDYLNSLTRAFLHDDRNTVLAELSLKFPKDPWLNAELGLMQRLSAPPPSAAASNNPHTERSRARHLFERGDIDECAAIWKDLAARTHQVDDYYGWLIAICERGDTAEALDAGLWVSNRFPGDYRVHLKLAQLYERRSDVQNALESFVRAEECEPANLDAVAGIARCLTYLGEFQKCHAWLELFICKKEAPSWALASSAFNAARQGKTSEAAESFGKFKASIRHTLENIAVHKAANPGAVWAHGRFLEGRSAASLQTDLAFDRHAKWLLEGDILLMGNAPTLLGTGLGAEIDRFSRVIRLNDFKLQGYGFDVGTRTDLWYSSLNRRSKLNISKPPCEKIWLCQPVAQHIPNSSFASNRFQFSLESSDPVFLPSHIHSLSSSAIYPRPTTGFRLITILEVLLEAQYSIAGFSFFNEGQNHYFDPVGAGPPVGEMHAIRFERDFVKDVLSLSDSFSRLSS